MVPSISMLIAIGCGSEVHVDGGGGAGGGDGGQGGQGGQGGNVVCDPFLDQASAGSVTFRVANQTGQDMYLRGSCGLLSYNVLPESGAGDTYYGDVGGSCQQSCEVLQTEPQVFCEDGACAPSSILIQPGQTRDFVWAGQGQKGVDMPAQCWFSPENGTTSCQQIVAAPAGPFVLNLTAFSDCGPDCTCDETGLCTGDASGFEISPDVSAFDFPAAAPVEIVFPSCAFGCPG